MIAPTSFFSDYGCSVRILEESRVLRRLGHDVMVCTYRNGQDPPGLHVRRTPSIPFREHYEVGSSPHKIGFDLLLFWTVLSAALRQRPDVIHAHMHEGALIGLIIARLLRLPLVFDFQGSLTSEMTDHKFLDPDSIFFDALYRLETAIDCRAPLILTSSQNAKNLLVEQFGCHEARIQTMPDCVDAKAFYPPSGEERPALLAHRQRLGIPTDRKVVVYLGLLADYQGTDLLLQAAAHMLAQRDDLHFLIMGFPSVVHYQAKAWELGIWDHTAFPGKIPYAEARDYLALGDVAVAPKLSATEGSGKILNYMAMGLPTVAFDTPVSREYLGDLGVYAEPGDAASLADGLLTALSDGAGRARGAALRRQALAAYTWDHAAGTIIQAYERVCQP
jgi:glycosyltransferase involved in cell wall biosynthesis